MGIVRGSCRRAHGQPVAAGRRAPLQPAPRRSLQAFARKQPDARPDVKPWEAAVGAAALAIAMTVAPMQSSATDAAATGACLLRSCQKQLAGCLADVNCLEDLICLNKCNGREDEKECQIRCGDQYEDQAVQTFNLCAVSDKNCVPQQNTEGAYPVPKSEVLAEDFDTDKFQGRWYITAGYNTLFDTFDCQEHYFTSPEPGKIFAKINWRIKKPDGDFFQRSVVQRFVQDDAHPSQLYNHGNEYLHYEDDWYVAAWKPDAYAFIYYKGNNDAWKGYGGATVYTRDSALPEEYEPVFREAAKNVGLKWEDFTKTDNTCKPHPQRAGFPFNLFNGAQQLEARLVKELEGDLQSFGKGFTVFESQVGAVLSKEEKEIEREISEASKVLRRMEKRDTKQPKVSTATLPQPTGLPGLPHEALCPKALKAAAEQK